MRKVPVNYLREGMEIGSSIRTSSGLMLVREGTILTQNVVKSLQSMNFTSVVINDGLLEDVELEDVIADEVRVEAIQKTRKMFDKVEVAEKAGSIHFVVDTRQIAETVDGILEGLFWRSDMLASLADIRTFDDYLYGHSVNTCILSLMTGKALELSEGFLANLGAGALLHDIGKLLVPKKILEKPEKLTKEEFDVIKKHPEYGYTLLRSKSKISALTAFVVREHHEKVDGTGYPKGIAGDKIHKLSRIVKIADVYDALIADRVYKKGIMPHEVCEILSADSDGFDQEILKVFLENIAIYPVGCFIELDTGQVGAVVKVRKGFAHHPVVRVFFEEKTAPVADPYEIDLSENTEIKIDRVLDFKEVDNMFLGDCG